MEKERSLLQNCFQPIRASDAYSITLSFCVESMCQPTRMSTVSCERKDEHGREGTQQSTGRNSHMSSARLPHFCNLQAFSLSIEISTDVASHI